MFGKGESGYVSKDGDASSNDRTDFVCFRIHLSAVALVIWSSFPFPRSRIILHFKTFPVRYGSFTFPLGVVAASTIQIGLEMPSAFFRVLGTAFSTVVVLLWIVVAAGTAKGAWSGELFYAPCLGKLKKKEEDMDNVSEAKARRVA